MANSTANVFSDGGIITTLGTTKMSVTPLTAVLTLTVYCELIASPLGFEQTIKTRKILCYGINGGYFTDGRMRDFAHLLPDTVQYALPL